MIFIKNRLLKEKLSDIDIIKTMEFIKIHNSKCHINNFKSLSSSDLYLVLNMINSGYEEIKIEPIYSEKLENAIKSTINAIESNLIFKEQEYVLKRVLKYYQDEIYALITLLKDKEAYFNISTLQSIKEEYKVLYQKYMFIRKKIDDIALNKKEIQNIKLDTEVPIKEENMSGGRGTLILFNQQYRCNKMLLC